MDSNLNLMLKSVLVNILCAKIRKKNESLANNPFFVNNSSKLLAICGI